MSALLTLFDDGPSPAFSANFMSGSLPAGLTYTNSSTVRTYFGSDGLLKTAVADEPIFEYDPLTLALKGMRWEMEQRTNLLLRSRDFTNAAWQGTGLTKTGGQTDASGGTSAVLLTGPSSGILIQAVITTASGAHTFKIAAKGVSGTTAASFLVRNISTGTNDVIGVVNPIAGTITSGAGWASRSIGNGFYEYTFTTSITITAGNVLSFYYGQAGLAPSGWNLIVDFAQLEAGSSSSSYIPTTSAAVTRQPDVLTATSISPWYRQDEGTVVFEGIASTPATAQRGIYLFGDGTDNERISAYRASGLNGGVLVVDGGVTQADISTLSSIAQSSIFRHALAYKLNDVAGSVNNGTPVVDTSATMPTVTALTLGHGNTAGTQAFMGYARRFDYYNTRLPNATIQGLSRV